MDRDVIPRPGAPRELDWTAFLSILVGLVGELLEARLYAGRGHDQLTNVRGRFTAVFDPFSEGVAELYIELGEALILVSERATTISCWVETFGEPQPRLVVELVRERTTLELEVVVGEGP